RELGDGGLWRCGDGPDDPRPAAILMCDIRRGRSAALRGELAAELVKACQEILGLRDDNINLEFTQHDGDEMYHTLYGGLSGAWVEGGADKLEAKKRTRPWRALARLAVSFHQTRCPPWISAFRSRANVRCWRIIPSEPRRRLCQLR